MKKLLITGHRGLLGSACVRHFNAAGGYDVHTAGNTNLLRDAQTYRLVNTVRPDIIVHCAAMVGGVKANRDFPVEFMLKNVQMQCNIMDAAHSCNVPTLIHIATSCMFPKDAAMPVEEASLFTGKFEDSVESYALAKICGWRLAKAYFEQYGRKYMTVAPSNIYGPGDNYSESAHVIPALIHRYDDAVLSGTPLKVWGDGSAVREFIYSDDVASAIEAVIAKWDSPEIVNIGSGRGTAVRELVELIGLTSPHATKPRIIWDESEPTGIPRKTFSIKKISSLGWTPATGLAEGLKKTWDDYLNHKPRRI